MGLEAGTKISDLVETNPLLGDPITEGDDHLRLIKTVLKADAVSKAAVHAAATKVAVDADELAILDSAAAFALKKLSLLDLYAYMNSLMQTYQLGTLAGVDTITASATPLLTAQATNGSLWRFNAVGANVAAVTLNIDSQGALPVVHSDGSAMIAGDIPAAGYPCLLLKRAADFVLLNPYRHVGDITLPVARTGLLRADAGVVSAGGGALVGFTKLTASNAAWAPNALTREIVVHVIGGGGNGAQGVNGAQMNGGAGGNSGEIVIGGTVAVAGTYAVTIGAATVASSFIGSGVSVTARGGASGVYGSPTPTDNSNGATTNSSTGVPPPAGTVLIGNKGGAPGLGSIAVGSGLYSGGGGAGANGPYGGGGNGGVGAYLGAPGVGVAGTPNSGAGGGGGAGGNAYGSAGGAGGAGGSGCVYVWEFA